MPKDLSHRETRDLLEGELNKGKDDKFIWVADVFEADFIYEEDGVLYRATYEIGEDAMVTIGTPEKVKIGYEKFAELTGVEILQTGSFKSMSGQSVDFSDADLDHLASKFNELGKEVPLVIGHNEGDDSTLINAATVGAPVVAYAKSVYKKGNTLYADFSEVAEKALPMIGEQLKRLSAELYNNFTDASGEAHGLALRRVSFVGTSAIAALDDVTQDNLAFGEKTDQETQVIFLHEDTQPDKTKTGGADVMSMTEAEIKKMQDENAKLKSDNTDLQTKSDEATQKLSETSARVKSDKVLVFMETHKEKGIISPALEALGLQKFLESLDDSSDQVQKFGEGSGVKETTQLDFMLQALGSATPMIKFGEMAEQDAEAIAGDKDALIVKYQESHKDVTYKDAALAVSKDYPELFR